MTREEIISLVSRINEIRSEVARLSGLQKELRSLESQLDGIADTPPHAAKDANSMVERVIALVETSPEREWTAEEVAETLAAKVPSVRAAVSKAIGLERVQRFGRGRFRAKVPDQAVKDIENEVIAA